MLLSFVLKISRLGKTGNYPMNYHNFHSKFCTTLLSTHVSMTSQMLSLSLIFLVYFDLWCFFFSLSFGSAVPFRYFWFYIYILHSDHALTWTEESLISFLENFSQFAVLFRLQSHYNLTLSKFTSTETQLLNFFAFIRSRWSENTKQWDRSLCLSGR